MIWYESQISERNNVDKKWRLLTGKYKLFRRSIKITYGKPYKVTDDLEIENKKLMNIITKMLIKERSNVKRKR